MTQIVRVETPGCVAARCGLSNDRGTWTLARTPGSVAVTVSGAALRVRCFATGEVSTATQAAMPQQNTSGTGGAAGAITGGAAIGAALGGTALAIIPPLGVVAVMTGAAVGTVAGNAAEAGMQPFRYPQLISLPMTCTAPDGAAAAPAVPHPFGLTVRGVTQEQAQNLGMGRRSAAQVLAVTPAGPAAAAGLIAGDLLLALNGQDLGDAADLEEQLATLPSHSPAVLRVWRGGFTFDVVMVRAVDVRS